MFLKKLSVSYWARGAPVAKHADFIWTGKSSRETRAHPPPLRFIHLNFEYFFQYKQVF